MPNPAKIFVSYSHQDAETLTRLKTFLRPLEREGMVDSWDDTRIRASQRWKQEIEQALAGANIAVLLVSQAFLASDFIADNELPVLLKAAETRGTKIMSVILEPCQFEWNEGLAQFQTVNPPDKPLIDMSPGDQSRVWLKLTEEIREAIADPS